MAAVLVLLAPLSACGKEATSDGSPSQSLPLRGVASAGAEPAPRELAPLVIFLGDSLTAGYGLPAEQGFPTLVAEQLLAEGRRARIVNAGVSGDTTAGGLRRLDWLLPQKPDVLVVGLGGNDGLRGLSLRETEENLRAIVARGKAGGARVLLLGMKLPPNYGPEYAAGFEAIFGTVAREEDVPLVPFLLEGVGGDPALNQPDGIHPNREGQQRVARNVLPYLRDLLR